MIPLQLLLRSESRNEAGMEALVRAASTIGLLPTATGTATISMRADDETFQRLFGRLPEPLAPSRGGQADFGSAGGYEALEVLVPPELVPYVQSITVASPPTRLR